MACPSRDVVLLASTACFLTLLRTAQADSRFFVEGKVYCDTCRTQFVTRLSEYLDGATVRLECSEREGGSLTYSVEGTTDDTGTYRLPVDGEHEEEICEIVLVKSNKEGCDEVSKDTFLRNSARITLTANSGMSTPVRSANPLGFLKKIPLPECSDVLKELGMLGTDTLA